MTRNKEPKTKFCIFESKPIRIASNELVNQLYYAENAKLRMMIGKNKKWILLSALAVAWLAVVAQPDDPRQKHYGRAVRPIFMEKCFTCHNGEDNKAGINFDDFFFISSLVREGELFQKIVKVVEDRSMPPDNRPPLQQAEIDTISFYVNSYLQAALDEKDPGVIPPRRLNNQEYKYVIHDLLDIEINVDSLFPSDPSGGEGFDNQAGTLYLTPLLIERYFDAAEMIVENFYTDETAWRALVPQYRNSFGNWLRTLWQRTFYGRDVAMERPMQRATEVLIPFATRAYRGFLKPQEQTRMLDFFRETYSGLPANAQRFDTSIKETLKLILISHSFLYRIESDPDLNGPYQIDDFELASRLSFFLWSSLPDEQLLQTAYRQDLHDPKVLEQEVLRMLADPKAKRLGEQFAVQWLELSRLKDPASQVDLELFPEFTSELSDAMVQEVALFFNNTLLESKNLLELIDSRYSFMNEDLARHYGISGVEGKQMRKVNLPSDDRGGVLGMAGVLTATSLPTRTSPVIRGKWVLEQILGTPPPPPPADVPALEASHDSTKTEETLRALLERHRADAACTSCHQAMDPIGLGLENFDAIGRWRTTYGKEWIEPSGMLKTGETFRGPAELRRILLDKKELFAKNFSEKMLSFALGRSILFKDSPTIVHLQRTLLENNFNSELFMLELTKSYPFRYKKSDTEDVPMKPNAG